VVAIGERGKPQPQGQPGFLRLDTVHQGDQLEGGEKAFITSTLSMRSRSGRLPAQRRASRRPIWSRFWSICCVSFHFASWAFIPTTAAIHQPMVARLLEKLRIESDQKPAPAKRRQRPGGDKNGAIIRKHIGYGYIDAKHADAINDFYREYMNPYLNYHRPCAQADVKIDEKGRKRVVTKRYQTPLETCRC